MAHSDSSPSVRKTFLSPMGIGLGILGVVAGLALAAPLVGIVLGIVLWAATGSFKAVTTAGGHTATGTSGSANRLDPFSVGEPWRFFVRDAQRSRDRFDETIATAGDGPLRERLESVGRQLDHAVDECNETAQRGHAMRQARRAIDSTAIARRLDIARTELATNPLDETLQRTIASLEAQLGSAERLDQVIDQAETRLRLLQAQLDEAVARAGEVALQRGDASGLMGVGADIDHVADEMEALRQALEETNALDGTGDIGFPEPS